MKTSSTGPRLPSLRTHASWVSGPSKQFKLVDIVKIRQGGQLAFLPKGHSPLVKLNVSHEGFIRFENSGTYAAYVGRLLGRDAALMILEGALPLFQGNPPGILRPETDQEFQAITNEFRTRELIFIDEGQLYGLAEIDRLSHLPAPETAINNGRPVYRFATVQDYIAASRSRPSLDPQVVPVTGPAAQKSVAAAAQVTSILEMPADFGLAVGQTNIGPVREVNQDYYRIVPDPRNPLRILLLAADGMGGNAAGERASNLAVRTSIAEMEKLAPVLTHISEENIDATIQEARREITRETFRDPETQGMGTTIEVIGINGNKLTGGHVGDSRVYHISSRGIPSRLTRDHSEIDETYVQQKFGDLTYPLSNAQLVEVDTYIASKSGSKYITRSLIAVPDEYRENFTTEEEQLALEANVDTYQYDLEPGDWIMVCTDGLSGPLAGNLVLRLNQYKQEGKTIQEAQRLLMEEALKTTRDNVTIILYQHPEISELLLNLASADRTVVADTLDQIADDPGRVSQQDLASAKTLAQTLSTVKDDEEIVEKAEFAGILLDALEE